MRHRGVQHVIQAMTMVLDFAPQHWTTGTRLVALALADRVNGDSLECWPSLADITNRTGLKERQVQRHIRQLEDEGIITRLGQRAKKDGTPGTNVWKWHLLITLPQRGVIHDTPGVSPTTPQL